MDVDSRRTQAPSSYEPPTVVGYGHLADLTKDNGLMGGLHFATGTMASLSSPAGGGTAPAGGGNAPSSQGVQGTSTGGGPTMPGGAHVVPGAHTVPASAPSTPSSGVAGTQVSHPAPGGTPGTTPSSGAAPASGTLAAQVTSPAGSTGGGSSGRGTLPFTGADVGAVAAIGGLSAALGTALRRVTRRRPSAS